MLAIIFCLLLCCVRNGVYGRSLSGQQRVVKTIESKHGQIKSNYSSLPSHALVINPTVIPVETPDTCYAVVRTKADPSKKFFGLEGWPSLYKPAVEANQYSAARMKLSNGPDSIEVGWMVNPSLYKDNEAHLYVKFQAGQKVCLNTECPGFVQVAKDVPLGYVPDRYSTIGSQQYTWKLFMDKHEDDGNWWVSMDDDKYGIGYWPKDLFTGLADVANQAEWGGEVYINKQQSRDYPEMGNGRLAVFDSEKSACFQHVTVVNEAHQNINPPDTERFATSAMAYRILDEGYRGDYFGRMIYYGGSG